MIETTYIDIDLPDGRLRSEITRPGKAGERPYLLLVSGWDQQPGMEASIQHMARRGYGTLRLDLSGVKVKAGQTEPSRRQTHLSAALAAYDALFVQPDVDPTHIYVVGESYGGYIAAMAAAERPLAGIVLRAPALYPDRGTLDPRLLDGSIDYQTYRESVAPSWHNQALEALRRSEVPTLVVSSEHDLVVPRHAVMSYLAAAAGPKAHRLIRGAGHFLSPAYRNEFTRVLKDWLEAQMSKPAFG